MTTFIIKRWGRLSQSQIIIHPLALALLMLVLFYQSFPLWIYQLDATAALPDSGIWSLLLLSVIIYVLLLLISSLLFAMIVKRMQLPPVTQVVSQFKDLELWQQFLLFWLSFALLLLAAVGCLIAVF